MRSFANKSLAQAEGSSSSTSTRRYQLPSCTKILRAACAGEIYSPAHSLLY